MGFKNSPAAIRYFYTECERRGMGNGASLGFGGELTEDGYRILQMGTDIARERGANHTTVADFKAAFADLETMDAQHAATASIQHQEEMQMSEVAAPMMDNATMKTAMFAAQETLLHVRQAFYRHEATYEEMQEAARALLELRIAAEVKFYGRARTKITTRAISSLIR